MTRGFAGIVTVCLLGLTARFVFALVVVPHFERQAHVAPDPDQYAELAASLLDRGELGFNPPGASPTSVRGPAFPAWLAAGMLVGGRSDRWISFWASIPGLIAAMAIVVVLGRSHGGAAGLIGGLLCAAHPLACFVSARSLSDEFYGTAVLLGILAWHSSLHERRAIGGFGWALLAGTMLATASLTRATGLVVVVLLLAIGLFGRPRRPHAWATLALVVACLVGAWTWRTSSLVGRPTFIESLAGYNFWLGESADRYGFAPSFGEGRKRAHELMARESGALETTSPSFWYAALPPREARALDEKLVDAGLRSIRKDPLAFARRFLTGFMWFWIRAETLPRTIQYAVVALPLLALAVVGMWRQSRQAQPGRRLMWVITAIVASHVAIYAAIWPMARLSVQVYPLVCYLAGVGCAARGLDRRGP